MKPNALQRILIPYREGIENKWWHRLLNVLIFGSTIVVIILCVVLPVDETAWKLYRYTAYSFQPDYTQARGKEITCRFLASDLYAEIDCGDYYSPEKFLDDYLKAYPIYKRAEAIAAGGSDNEILKHLSSTNKLDDVKVKRLGEIQYNEIFHYIVLAILIPLAWFIFWESILYRALLYVIYGKKKNNSVG